MRVTLPSVVATFTVAVRSFSLSFTAATTSMLPSFSPSATLSVSPKVGKEVAVNNATVVAVSKSGFVIKDATASMEVRTAGAPDVVLGDAVKVKGVVDLRTYDNGYDMVPGFVEGAAVENLGGGNAVAHGEAMAISAQTDMEAWLAIRTPLYVEIKGKMAEAVGEDGRCEIETAFTNSGYDGAAIFAYQTPDEMLAGQFGKDVIVRGYYIGQWHFVESEDDLGDTIYMDVMVTSIEENTAGPNRYNFFTEGYDLRIPQSGEKTTFRLYSDRQAEAPNLSIDNAAFTVEYDVDGHGIDDNGKPIPGYSAETGRYGWNIFISAKPNETTEEINATLTAELEGEKFEFPVVQGAMKGENEKTVTVLFSNWFEKKTDFDEEGSTYTMQDLDFTFYDISGKFCYNVGLSMCYVSAYVGDKIKIDGKGKTLTKVEWGNYSANASKRDLSASDGSDMQRISEMMGTREAYLRVWDGEAADITFTANADVFYNFVRVTYIK